MHVALTGSSGFIGSVIARHLHESGHSVTGLVRATSRVDHVRGYLDRVVVADQTDESAWPDLLDGADAVVHNAFDWAPLRRGDRAAHYRSNLLASVRLIDAAGDRRFVFMSTIAVHHDMRPRWGGRIDEDHPTRPAGLYGACKAAVEAHLWAAHFERGVHACSLRPCAVYGIDPDLPRSIGYPIVERLRRDGRYARAGGGKFVHVDDVAAATTAALVEPTAAGRVYNLADCYARWADWARIIAEELGRAAEIDDSSPPAPRNVFAKEAARNDLGVAMDRGLAGVREHVRTLIATMAAPSRRVAP